MIDREPDAESTANESRQEMADHVKSKSTWMRLVFMLIFVVLWTISRIVVGAVVVLQFLWVLFAGEPNPRLGRLGRDLATYTYQIVMYLTFNAQQRPFPYDDWPDGPPRD